MQKRVMSSLWVMLMIASPVVSAADSEPGRPLANWPQWRGPSRDGQVRVEKEWPQRLTSETLKSTWRLPLSPSYSGPIVSESAVFVTETKDEKNEVVRALDRHTGKQLWETSWEGALSVPFFAKANGDWIRSTPALDGDRLYVGGMRDVLVCLNSATGDLIWRLDFVQQFGSPVPSFGFICSPLIDGEFLYVQAGAGLCKIDKHSGKVIWRSLQDEGGMGGSAFSSPFLGNIAGQRILLVQTREKLAGVDPESGNVFWAETIPAFRGMNILTPTVIGDSIFTSSYGGKSLLFQVKATNSGLNMEEQWTNKVTGYMSSPVAIDGHVYLHLQNQRFTCIEIATGKTKWTTTPFGKYWSMVANRNRILALDERGELLLIEANPQKFEQIDSFKISEDPAWAHLAVCGDELFIRELNAIAAYRWSTP